MTIMTEKEAIDKKNAVLQLFQILFPNYKITLLPCSLILSGNGVTTTVDESNFEIM
jgi:hypothetical protein